MFNLRMPQPSTWKPDLQPSGEAGSTKEEAAYSFHQSVRVESC